MYCPTLYCDIILATAMYTLAVLIYQYIFVSQISQLFLDHYVLFHLAQPLYPWE